MPRTLALAGLLAAMAGCLASPSPQEVASLPPQAQPAGGEVRVEGALLLGWIAAAGANSFAGDLVVGLRSADHCPEATFQVPEGATDLRLDVPPARGVGAYQVAVASPGAVHFYAENLAGGEQAIRFPTPEPGTWWIGVAPVGATAAQQWDVLLSYALPAGPADAAVQVAHDPRCV